MSLARPWWWVAPTVVLTALALLVPYLVGARARTAEHLGQRFRTRQAAFEKIWRERKWREGEDCNRSGSVRPGQPLIERASISFVCSRNFVKDSFAGEPAGQDLIDKQSITSAVDSLTGMEPARCVLTVLELVSYSRGVAAGGSYLRAMWAQELNKAAILSGLSCLAKLPRRSLVAPTDSLIAECRRGPYAAGVYEWELLDASSTLQTLYRKRPFIPQFWNPPLRRITSGGSLLAGWRQLLDYAERVEAMSSQRYPELAEPLSKLIAEASREQTLLSPFGASPLERYRIVDMELSDVARVRAFACGVLIVQGDDAVCENECTDPFNGHPLRVVDEENRVMAYSLGRNGADDSGKSDDLGINVELKR
jgi:hypothetical protein